MGQYTVSQRSVSNATAIQNSYINNLYTKSDELCKIEDIDGAITASRIRLERIEQEYKKTIAKYEAVVGVAEICIKIAAAFLIYCAVKLIIGSGFSLSNSHLLVTPLFLVTVVLYLKTPLSRIAATKRELGRQVKACTDLQLILLKKREVSCITDKR